MRRLERDPRPFGQEGRPEGECYKATAKTPQPPAVLGYANAVWEGPLREYDSASLKVAKWWALCLLHTRSTKWKSASCVYRKREFQRFLISRRCNAHFRFN